MIPYQKEKIENAICFFAHEHMKKTRQSLYQTFLYKYLAFLDFEILKETGRPCLGLSYMAMEHGPVPMEIYGKLHEWKSSCFTFTEEQDNKKQSSRKASQISTIFLKKRLSKCTD